LRAEGERIDGSECGRYSDFELRLSLAVADSSVLTVALQIWRAVAVRWAVRCDLCGAISAVDKARNAEEQMFQRVGAWKEQGM
jgi:hypothetical protein